MFKHKKLAVTTAITTALVASSYLAPSVFAQTNQYIETNHGWVSYHSKPSTSSSILGRLQVGDKAPFIEKYNSYWYEIEVNGKDVYITTNSNFTHVVNSTTSTRTTGSSSSDPSKSSTSTLSLTAKQQKLMTAAKSQIGVPYLWGKQLPGVGFDCSNFTSWVYKSALGITFSSSSRTQRYSSSIGKPVAMNATDKLANLQVGDLLFFKNSADPGDGTVGQAGSGGGGHVGIYAGNGMVIQEGGGRAKVTYEKMQGTWFLPALVYAKRIL